MIPLAKFTVGQPVKVYIEDRFIYGIVQSVHYDIYFKELSYNVMDIEDNKTISYYGLQQHQLFIA